MSFKSIMEFMRMKPEAKDFSNNSSSLSSINMSTRFLTLPKENKFGQYPVSHRYCYDVVLDAV
jgi:hypothetical protein